MIALKALAAAAQENGWATVEGSMESLGWQVRFSDWALIPSRKNGPQVETLTPTTAQAAPKQSLSATYGQGAQPLHTDGAHHPNAPDLVILSVDEPSAVPTLLWRLDRKELSVQTWSDLRHGLFTVRTGDDAFLAPAFTDGRLRFDPGCMTPSDARARRVVEFFEAKRDDAALHQWSSPGTLLAIDNRMVLHARASAEEEPGRVLRRASIRMKGA